MRVLSCNHAWTERGGKNKILDEDKPSFEVSIVQLTLTHRAISQAGSCQEGQLSFSWVARAARNLGCLTPLAMPNTQLFICNERVDWDMEPLFRRAR